jgi:hypothetical protein
LSPAQPALERKPSLFIEKIYDLNRGFAVTLAAFERLERLGMFRRNYLRAFRTMADELRARSNYELTETLRDREGRETARFSRLRLKWENRCKSPGDAGILKQQKKKKRQR